VLDATRGKEAKRLARRHGREIDLAVVDVIMPELSGPELIRQIKPLCPNMRVLYVSGYNNEAIPQLGVSDSGAAFLAKPFMPEDLARSVRKLLDGMCNHAAE
jgi:two-component system, cell cycle sensor histidine kinase and response regulator CckA